jgi:hypothetical protein
METGILTSLTCETSVGLLRAIFLGVPDGGCVELGFGSLALALVVFALAVSGLQWIVRRLLFGAPDASATPGHDGPVWSAREEANRRRAGIDSR